MQSQEYSMKELNIAWARMLKSVRVAVAGPAYQQVEIIDFDQDADGTMTVTTRYKNTTQVLRSTAFRM